MTLHSVAQTSSTHRRLPEGTLCLFSLERGYLLTVSRDLNQGNEGTVPPKNVRFFSLFWHNILIRTLETPLLGLSETCRIFRGLNL